MSKQDELKQIYIHGINKIFLEKDQAAVTAAWNELFSKDLLADSLGQTFTFDSFLSAIFDMKRNYVAFKIEFVQILSIGRRVGTYEVLKMQKGNGDFDHARAIIHAEFGEVGTKDEKKVIVFREAMEFGPVEKGM